MIMIESADDHFGQLCAASWTFFFFFVQKSTMKWRNGTTNLSEHTVCQYSSVPAKEQTDVSYFTIKVAKATFLSGFLSI